MTQLKRFFMILTMAGCSLGTVGSASAGIIINEPGYVDSAVGIIQTDFGNAFGAVASSGGVVYSTGAFSEAGLYRFTSNVGTPIASFDNTSLSLQIVGNTAYVGLEGGHIYAVDLTTNVATDLGDSGVATALSLAVAPTGFGGFGGQLIVSGINQVVAFDPNTSAVTGILSVDGYQAFSGSAFTNDGRLLVAQNLSGEILQVGADGSTSLFATTSEPGAIAVNPNTGDVYVANELSGTIVHYLADGTLVGDFASNVSWDGGYYPSMLAFSPDGSALIYGELNINDHAYGIRQITASTAIPEPSTWISFTIAGGLAFVFARRRQTT
ncbi:MAG: PEP-CTERM sorting domain-containing protein [Planctomycetes bacterium]|nr:PEP-CTERM sorting domain-containing protein [Planctomycetota bacterium]